MIEMIVAVAVIILILTGLITATTSSLSRSIDVSNRSQATKLAQNAIEHIRSLRDTDWDRLASYTGETMYFVNGEIVDSEHADPDAPYIHTVEFTNCGSTCVSIVSTVSWQEKGESKEVSLESKVTRWK